MTLATFIVRSIEMDEKHYIAALHRQRIEANGCTIEILGPMTGHFVKPIAFCDSPETARALVSAMLESRKAQP